MTDLIGRNFGQYHIIEKIGIGGMATVYRAFQPRLDRYVAIKILIPVHAEQPGFSERFKREAKAIASLHHPNILPIYDFGQDEDYSFIVMRYVEGARTLKEEMRTTLSLERIVDLIVQIGDALDYAHQQGIIHRDVKPSNVLVDGDWALLTDFGLAKMTEASVKLTGSGVGIGTPAYMSPEQGQGLPVDHRTDIYSLGIILFEMLTNQIPHDAETPFAIVLKRMTEPLPLPSAINPEISETVEKVILKALAKAPEGRYQSTKQMAAALREAVESEERGLSPEPKPVTVVRDASKQPALAPERALPRNRIAGVGLVVFALIVVMFLLTRGGDGDGKPASLSTDTSAPVAAVIPAPTDTPRSTARAEPSSTVEAPITTATHTPSPTVIPPAITHPPTPTPIPPTVLHPPSPTPIPPTVTPSPSLEPTSAILQLTSGIGNNIQPSFSSDGSRIAFISTRDGNQEIYVMNSDGSEQIRLTNTANINEDLPSFSPDGSMLIFGSYDGNDEELFVMNADGSQVRNISNSPYSNEGRPKFIPGSFISLRVIFDSDRSGSWEIYSAPFELNRLGAATQITNRPQDANRLPSFVSSSDRILFRSETSSGGKHIYLIGIDGTNLTKLSADYNDWYPIVSNDGKWIVFVSDRDGNEELYAMNLNGSDVKRLTDNLAQDTTPAISSDGQWLVFASNRGGSSLHLFRVPFDPAKP